MLSKYAAALLHVLVVVLAALVTALDHGLTLAGVLQLAILAIGAAAVYFLPLADSKTGAELKVAAAVVTAILTALLPLIVHAWSFAGITGSEWITVILAGLGILLSALGVDARISIPPLAVLGGTTVNVTSSTPAPAAPVTAAS